MSRKKNIIIIMTDQQRADVCKREGFPLDTTPFLDALAARGTWFNRAYTAMPICVPARTSMLTGRMPSAHRVQDNSSARHVRAETDMYQTLREHGYTTALIGKSHTYLNLAKDCDYALEFGHFGALNSMCSEADMAFDKWLSHVSQVETEPSPFPVELQMPSRIVDASIDWVSKAERDNPFFLWMSFPEPHNPYQVPEPYFSMFPPEELPKLGAWNDERNRKGFKWRWTRQLGEHFARNYEALISRGRSNYFGMLRMIDDQIKRFVEFLEQTSRIEDTILIFLSDHGDFVGEYGLIKKGPEAPDILSRIPLLVVGPNVIANQEPHPAHVSIVDLFPTLCDIANVPGPRGVQGRSLWPMLQGQPYPQREFSSVYVEHGYGGQYYTDSEPLDYDLCGKVSKDGVIRFDELNKYSQSGYLRSVRKGDWKLNMDMYGHVELYEITRDRLELTNLAGSPEYVDVEKSMLAELCTWMMRSEDTLPYPANETKYPLKRHPRNYSIED